jgi:hypothetical protein
MGCPPAEPLAQPPPPRRTCSAVERGKQRATSVVERPSQHVECRKCTVIEEHVLPLGRGNLLLLLLLKGVRCPAVCWSCAWSSVRGRDACSVRVEGLEQQRGEELVGEPAALQLAHRQRERARCGGRRGAVGQSPQRRDGAAQRLR